MSKRSHEMPSMSSVSSNPHILQVCQPGTCYVSHTDVQFERKLHKNAPQSKYRRRRNEIKTVIHWGQMKLLLCEIEFLTRYSTNAKTVLYVGAAPGTHIVYLMQLFPHLNLF